MTFVRFKRRRGIPYGYLVENRWDPKAGQPRQRVLQYLGPASSIQLSALPKVARTPALIARIKEASDSAEARRASRLATLKANLTESLTKGDFPTARVSAMRALREIGVNGLYGELLPQVFFDIGKRWADGSLSVSQEHLASGMAVRIVEQVNSRQQPTTSTNKEVVLCVPDGESHTLGLLLAEGLLLKMGIVPVNIASSAPSTSTLLFVTERRPTAVFISLTNAALITDATRLALQIRRRTPGTQVIIGGQGVRSAPTRIPYEGVSYVTEPFPTFLRRWTRQISRRGREER
jgi:methanogenic corrinoid protein MtbC1